MNRKLGQFAGMAIIPTLSRIVLAMAFVTAGYGKIFTSVEYSPEEVDILETLGVRVMEAEARAAGAPVIVLASYRQDAAEEKEKEEESTPVIPSWMAGLQTQESKPEGEGEGAVDAEDAGNAGEVVDADQEATPVIAEPVEITGNQAGVTIAGSEEEEIAGSEEELIAGSYFEHKQLYKVALLLHREGWQYPVVMSWVAALTELVGGALILVGLFSRVWALGLAITMVAAFATTSLHQFAESGMLGLSDAAYGAAYLQLGLFVLAFGVLLTGPGPLSVDCWLFRTRPAGGTTAPKKMKKVVKRVESSKPTQIPIPQGKPLTDVEGEFDKGKRSI